MPRNGVNKSAIVVELKYNKTADAAIEQIKDRQYVEGLKAYKGEVLLVGINYNADSDAVNYKKHECIIEKIRIQ